MTKDNPSSSDFSLKRIMVAVDGSPNSKRAARAAIELAKNYDSELTAVHVIEAPGYFAISSTLSKTTDAVLAQYHKRAREKAEEWVGNTTTLAKSKGVMVKSEILDDSSPVKAIIERARALDVDLIVVGTRGLSDFKKLLIGSVSSGIVSHAHCSVLVVR